jgi:hypothetical protein
MCRNQEDYQLFYRQRAIVLRFSGLGEKRPGETVIVQMSSAHIVEVQVLEHEINRISFKTA